MRTSKNLLAVVTAAVACMAVIWFSRSIHGGERSYEVEVQPQVSTPEYRTEAARAIDAYERLMERYMNLTERNIFGVGEDVRYMVKRLDSIDGKLADISARIARIEKAMGIEQPKLPPAGENPQLEVPDKKAPKKPPSPQ